MAAAAYDATFTDLRRPVEGNGRMNEGGRLSPHIHRAASHGASHVRCANGGHKVEMIFSRHPPEVAVHGVAHDLGAMQRCIIVQEAAEQPGG